ncbi:MAG TPA: hypothetical protein VGM75_29115 [Pseudonocardiaceae bacterium]
MKPVDDTALTVPIEPPSSLDDRVFDPPPAPRGPLGGALCVVVVGAEVEAEVDVQPASTSVPAIAAAVTIIHRRLPRAALVLCMTTFLSTWVPSSYEQHVETSCVSAVGGVCADFDQFWNWLY